MKKIIIRAEEIRNETDKKQKTLGQEEEETVKHMIKEKKKKRAKKGTNKSKRGVQTHVERFIQIAKCVPLRNHPCQHCSWTLP